MIELEKLKKGNLFHNWPVVYKVADNDVQKETIKLMEYEAFIDASFRPRQVGMSGGEIWSSTYRWLRKNLHGFMFSREFDEKLMKEFIAGIFGDIKSWT